MHIITVNKNSIISSRMFTRVVAIGTGNARNGVLSCKKEYVESLQSKVQISQRLRALNSAIALSRLENRRGSAIALQISQTKLSDWLFQASKTSSECRDVHEKFARD